MSFVNYFRQDRDLSLPGLSARRAWEEGFPNSLQDLSEPLRGLKVATLKVLFLAQKSWEG